VDEHIPVRKGKGKKYQRKVTTGKNRGKDVLAQSRLTKRKGKRVFTMEGKNERPLLGKKEQVFEHKRGKRGGKIVDSTTNTTPKKGI